MKATLHIEENAELRDTIKSMVEGQVRGVARKEITQIALKEAEKRIPAMFSRHELRSIIIGIMTPEELREMFNSAVENMTNQYIESIINERVSQIVNGDIRRSVSDAINKEIAGNLPKINLSVDRS